MGEWHGRTPDWERQARIDSREARRPRVEAPTMTDPSERDRKRLRTNLAVVSRRVEAIAEPIDLGQWDTILTLADELVDRVLRLQRQAIRAQAVRSSQAVEGVVAALGGTDNA